MSENKKTIPDSTAVRVALWRAMHVQIDQAPHILEDEVGLLLAAPDENWRQRPDMHPQGTSGYRASIVGRARYLEDLVLKKLSEGVHQYVILGAGLDTFAERRPEVQSQLTVFEIDQPETQAWKKQRLIDTGLGIPKNLKFVPVNFEVGESWRKKLLANDFKDHLPVVISSTGVSMYLTKEANMAALREVAEFAPGSVLALTFILTMDLIEPADRAGHEMVYKKAKEAGTPFLSFFTPSEIMEMALKAGFRKVEHISRDDLIRLYFKDRTDELRLSSGEEFLIAYT